MRAPNEFATCASSGRPGRSGRGPWGPSPKIKVETSKARRPLRFAVQAAVLGTGGLGRIITLELASDPRVDEIVIADKRGDRSRALKSLGKTAAIQAIEADVTDPYALRRVLGDADVVVNATLPEYNLRVMQARSEEHTSELQSPMY